ncbi:hypothetical protein VRU48_03975 [Pedobacter sp. KR3-3]|uniref:Uncharacterized protein n=1 Tax=Pedobacter albus TaxID=3113905 RepID=A0ABU7I459_9SPHI|nr:hypothetical protein [Pedobacter sp. KR3-3]MEE1944252.1 hypothetical protein [Pedobacter sp. KR3-3]
MNYEIANEIKDIFCCLKGKTIDNKTVNIVFIAPTYKNELFEEFLKNAMLGRTHRNQALIQENDDISVFVQYISKGDETDEMKAVTLIEFLT